MKTQEKTKNNTEELNIYEKLSKITNELATVGKNLKVGSGNYGYNAVSERDIIDAIKPMEEKYGLYSYPFDRKVIESRVSEWEEYQKTKRQFAMRVETTYRFVNTSKPSEHIDIISYGDGLDAADKAPGKAMTYSDKYALMKAYKISTGDDTDATHSRDIPVPAKAKERPILTEEMPEFEIAKEWLKDEKNTIEKLEKKYMLSSEIKTHLNTNKLNKDENDKM